MIIHRIYVMQSNMSSPIYSIIDIETTGGLTSLNRITEIAIVNIQDGQIVEEYETLIHPERMIPTSISYFTGITNEMVESAPKFHQVAKKIVEMTLQSIFVAHNVYFDYNFIKAEFASLGFTFNRPRLCTVRLSRLLIPGHRSYSLGKICADLGIGIENRHRAMGDVRATVELFRKLLEKNPDLHEMSAENKERILFPPNVNREEYEQLPTSPGIYYFWNQDGQLLYVGKSKNIKKRVASHFRLNIHHRKEIDLKASIHKVTFEKTGNDLCAQLLECQKIKTLRPQFNRSMNRVKFPYVVEWSENSIGYMEPQVRKILPIDNPSTNGCTNKRAAKKKIDRTYHHAFGIEAGSMMFDKQLQNFKDFLGKKLFNERIQKDLDRECYPHENFLIRESGRTRGETAHILIEERRLQRIEYWNEEGRTDEYVLQEDQDMRRIFLMYLRSSVRVHAT